MTSPCACPWSCTLSPRLTPLTALGKGISRLWGQADLCPKPDSALTSHMVSVHHRAFLNLTFLPICYMETRTDICKEPHSGVGALMNISIGPSSIVTLTRALLYTWQVSLPPASLHPGCPALGVRIPKLEGTRHSIPKHHIIMSLAPFHTSQGPRCPPGQLARPAALPHLSLPRHAPLYP